ncbi:lipoprotein insertase outer membrane protein LolB [Endothiovibrio diazotrophicus]
MRRLAAVPLLALLLVAGCAAPPPRGGEEGGAQRVARQQARQAVERWVVDGRVAVLREAESWHASLHWEQQGKDQGERYRIQLTAPLGQGGVVLRGLPGSVMMEYDGGAVMAADPESLLERHLGWRIPVTGLRYWVRGLPDPATAGDLHYGEDGHPDRLDQEGWKIEFRRWGEVDGLALPEKVFMESAGLKVRLVIDRWQLPAS